MAETRFISLIGQSYNLRNVQFDCQRTINWIPEIDETQRGKNAEIAQFIPTPGLRPVLSGLAGGSKGGYVASNGVCYWVFGGGLYKLTATSGDLSSFTATLLYTGANSQYPAYFTDNSYDLFVLINNAPYVCNLDTDVVTPLTGGAFGQSSSQTFFDGYIVYSRVNSNQFYWTDLYSTTASGLNFASAEANPDKIVGLINNNLDLWIFGRKTIELWYNYGANNTVFQRRPNTLIEMGCASAASIKKLNNSLFWLAQDERGGYMLMQAKGYTPQRVSTYAIEQQWDKAGVTDIEKAIAYTYQEGGHNYYAINITGTGSTWVYDMTVSDQMNSPTWHERQTLNVDTGLSDRHIAEGHAYYKGFHLTGDATQGNLYVMDNYYYYDNLAPVIRERTAPHISNNMDRIRYNNVTCDFYTGQAPNPDINPQIMMQFSDDGGLTWSNEYWQSAGLMGEYSIKVQFLRLGMTRSRVFRFRCSDPIYWAWSGASLNITPAAH
jgi:hypothetical protein